MIVEKFLFSIYNSYYKNGNYKNDDPIITVWGILTASTFFAILGTTVSLFMLVSHKEIDFDSIKWIIFPVLGLHGAGTYWYFSRTIEAIYEKYKTNPPSIYWKWASWLIILILFLIGLSPAFIKLLSDE